MKKIILLITTIISLFIMSGCSNDDTTNNSYSEFDITGLISHLNGEKRNYEYTYTREYDLDGSNYSSVYVTKVDDSIEYTEHTIITTTITNLETNEVNVVNEEEYRVLIADSLYVYTKPDLVWQSTIEDYENTDVVFSVDDFSFNGEYYFLSDDKQEELNVNLEIYSDKTIKLISNIAIVEVYNFDKVNIILPDFDIKNNK